MNGAVIIRTGVAIGALGLAGGWAFAPLERSAAQRIEPAAARGDPEPSVEPLDLDAFRTPLWVSPPAPPPEPKPEPPPPAPPPLRLELVAIVQENAALTAVLYDIDADRLVVAGEGDDLGGGRVVTKIGVETIEISGPRGPQTLSTSAGGRP